MPFPRTELLYEGWGCHKLAQAFEFVEVSTVSSTSGVVPPGAGGTKFRKAESQGAPKGFWREPSTGVLMLEPSFLASDYEVNEEYRAWEADAAYFRRSAMLGYNAAMNSLLTERPTASSLVEALVGLATNAVADAALTGDGELVWAAESVGTLAQNEGFGLLVTPAGVSLDRASHYMGVSFGHRYALTIQGNGEVSLWFNYADDPVPLAGAQWRRLAVHQLANGGVFHTQPFRVGVIPWGTSHLTLLFSQRDTKAPSSFLGSAINLDSLTVDLSAHDILCPWDPAMQHMVKTVPAPVRIALAKSEHQYTFKFFRIRYPLTAMCHVGVQPLTGLKPGAALDASGRGFWDFDMTGAYRPQCAVLGRGVGGAVFDPDTDEQLVWEVQLTASVDRVHTPELWSLQATVPATTFTPDWTPDDLSAKWTRLRFQLRQSPEPGRIEAGLIGDGAGWSDWLRPRTAPIRVRARATAGGAWVSVFDGYILRRGASPKGPNRIGEEELEGGDMWDRLERAPLDWALEADGKPFGVVLRGLLRRAGFLNSEIVFEGQSAEELAALEEIPVPKSATVGTVEQWGRDMKVADALRDLLGRFGLQYRRPTVRWRRGAWRVRFEPYWPLQADYPAPVKRFYLRRDLVPLVAGRGRTDAERWNVALTAGAEQHFLLHSTFDISVSRPPYNHLRLYNSTGTGQGSGGMMVEVPPDPRELTDQDYFWFTGQLHVQVGGEQSARASTVEELAVQARTMYAESRSALIRAQASGEWQPHVEDGDIVAILTAGDDGLPASLGAWLVESVDVELRHDHSEGGASRRFEWSGEYQFVYKGWTDIAGFPMVPGLPESV